MNEEITTNIEVIKIEGIDIKKLSKKAIQFYFESNNNIDIIREYLSLARQKAQEEFKASHLQKSNHIIGCELECYENVLRYRGYDKEANELMEIASKLK